MNDRPDALRVDLRAAWHRYVDELAPIRPALHDYCRRLTGNLWDAEDLAQDTLLRAFGRWGVTYPAIRDPRAYLLRTATNVWIDTLRRRRLESLDRERDPDTLAAAGADPSAAGDVRDAGTRLLQRLSPQERVALVLKEAFDMSLEEIADLLSTTTGAVKAALHRGRGRLATASDPAQRPLPSTALLDRFVVLFDAKDVAGLIALLVEGAVAENVGTSMHVGLDPDHGVPHFLHKVVHGHADWPPEAQWEATRLERAEVEHEPVLLIIATRGGMERLMSVLRFDEVEGRIARIRSYGFCPETIRAIGGVLSRPVLTGLYRAPSS